MRSGRQILAMALSALLLLVAGWLGATPLHAGPEAPNAVGWVGSMYPVGGSTNSLEVGSGGGFNVYVQVWKSGVTEAPGPGAGIQCFLNWGPSGGSRSDQAMVFNVQIGNNDEYRATIATGSLPIGTYAFSAYCTDDGGANKTWQGAGDGFLVITPPQARALWVDEGTIAWDTGHGPGGGVTYRLHYAPDGSLDLPTTPGSSILLTYDSVLTGSSYPKFPNASGYKALKIGAGDLALVPAILKGEIAIAAYDGGGTLLATTGVQSQGVLDDLYAYSGPLGLSYAGAVPTLRLWAPTARTVTFHRFTDALTTTASIPAPMTLDPATGVWSITGSAGWDKQYYLFEVEVFVHETDQVEQNLVTDPYSVNLSVNRLVGGVPANAQRSQMVDLYGDSTLKPPGWDSLSKPPLDAPEDVVVYELHVRDFSINDPSVPAPDRGSYRAFAYDGSGLPLSNGMQHLSALGSAGLTHIHLLPVADSGTMVEDAAQRQEPPDLTIYGPAASDQQAAIAAIRTQDGFNWGYETQHFGAPEGAYATDPNSTARVLEFRQMVQALNESGLRVVLDMVYNHAYRAGQSSGSVLDKIVPGYYQRLDANGQVQTQSCCPDTAAEFDMMQRLMIDTVTLWATAYKVDSFRFDLMNFHTRANMEALRDEVQALTVASDGVDGSEIYLYGEGWDFGGAKDKGFVHASQFNMAGTGIGTFNDRVRDAAHGGFSTDSLMIRQQGFINGLSYDWNGYLYPNRFQGDLRYQTDRLRVGLAGNLQGYEFIDQAGTYRTGATFNGTGYALDPQEAVNYIDKHDNETLYDLNLFKAPLGEGGTPVTTMAERVRIQNMGLDLIGLGQGIPFFHAGSDMLRSKSLDRNSYDSGDWFNRLDFTYTSNNFGVGLPPAWDNSARWPIMTPLLTNAALNPTQSDILGSVTHFRELLQLRESSPLFRLRTADEVNRRLHFWNTGPSQQDGLIVMTLSDAVGADLDPSYEFIVVLFNAHRNAQSYTMGALAGLPFTLHPVQAASSDPVVQGANFNGGTGAFNVPARTTAVFVSTVAPTTSGGIDWIGDMYPDGGTSTARQVGSGSNLTVYVQAYEPSITPGGGRGPGVACYLHWGRYGQAWSDLPMSYNVDIGNNDEYMATIPTAALPVGTYGFTAYCTMNGGATRTWRQPADGGDGILSIMPTPTPPPSTAFVHLFEWKWSDIAQECPYLASKGYGAVQVSPPQEHLLPMAPNYPWWVRYQPVSYSLGSSRSGTLAEFQAMVSTCSAAGVDIYVDAVINHMTGLHPNGATATGSNGTVYSHYNYPGSYGSGDFHYCGTALGNPPDEHNIFNYGNRSEVQTCELLSLADLNTASPTVQATIRAYLQSLLDMGVAGFRIDGSKHMAAHEMEAILSGLTPAPYVFQEVIDLGGEPVRSFEYAQNGDVTEFEYSQAIADAFTQAGGCAGPNLSPLASLGSGLLDSGHAVVFTDNHDNQRGHGPGGGCIVDHRDGVVYNLANIFMLAHPYGYPSVMSSYYWDGVNDNAGPPGVAGVTTSVYDGTEAPGDAPARCADGTNWVCEHRRTAIANMVGFRQVTDGQALTNWWDNGANQIAFGRGTRGFVAINREAAGLTRTFQTSMAAGAYCDVTRYDTLGSPIRCVLPGTATDAPAGDHIIVDATGQIVNETVASMDAFAIHFNSRIGAPLAVDLESFEAQAISDAIRLTWQTTSEVNNLGFNVYRSSTVEVPTMPQNGALLPSQGPGSTQGFAYEWLDSTAESGILYHYWLEDVDRDGTRTLHGPVTATLSAPTAITLERMTSREASGMGWQLALMAGAVLGLAAWRMRRR